MQAIGEYLVGVTAAALLCGLVPKLGFGKLNGAVIRLLCGVFMALAVLAPWTKLKLKLPTDFISGFESYGEELAAQGENSSRQAMEEIITRQVGTYILDKAASLGLDVTVEVALSGDEFPVPVGVTLRGAAAPYGKGVLEEYIRDQLGISKEAVKWIT